MKALRFSLIGRLVFAFTILTSGVAQATKYDTETHTLMIDKLETALRSADEDETIDLKPVRSRLADLYADRARLRAMDEVEKGCSSCKGAAGDRKRALQLYTQVLKDSDRSRRAPVMLQMGHVNELNGNAKAAESLYSVVIREGEKSHERQYVAQAYAARGELRFARADFKNAQNDLETSYRLSAQEKRGYLLYRIAWAQLNRGEQKNAVQSLVKLLQSPDLLTRPSTNGPVFDVSFQEDAARDLATFIARGPVTTKDIRMVESLAPERAKKDIVKHLASECERLGQPKAALVTWGVFLEHESGSLDRLEAIVRMTQIRLDLGQKKDALAGVQQAVAEWKDRGCRDEQICKNLQVRLRKVVTDWNKMEKKKPSSGLFDAYIAYISLFDSDIEMTYWAAEIARKHKKYKDAVSLYHKSSVLSSREKSPSKEIKKIFEASLVGEIEMAELAKDINLRESAYEHYLAMNPNGDIAHKVRYQRSHIAYERNDSRLASKRFNEFAASDACRTFVKGKNAGKSESAELCIKAADLDLDSLVLLKNDEAVEKRALEYAPHYPQRRTEYYKIARTSALKQSEKMQPNSALKKLAGINFTGASQDERVQILKTRISLAVKAQDLKATRQAAGELLAVKKLSSEDKEYALGQMAWAAEMSLDFNEAYNVSKKMTLSTLQADERAMRLAVLAELAGKNPSKHENEFLKLSRNAEKRAFLRAKIIRRAKNPKRELAKHDDELKRFPAIYADLALEIYAKTNDETFARKALKVRGVAKQTSGQAISRILFVKDFEKLDKKIAKHKIRSSSDYLMQKTLGERISLLGQVEQHANDAIASGDWATQIITLNVASRESKRLHSDIIALPVPKKLKGKERETYLKLVQEQAKPYLDKHAQIEKKAKEFWDSSQPLKQICADYEGARTELRPLLAVELKKVRTVAPWNARRIIDNTLKSNNTPSAKAVASARERVKEDPFSVSRLKKLKDLEEGRGQETMAVYLGTRIAHLSSSDVSRK